MAKRLRRDDMVVVIAGRDKGTTGRILKVISETDRVIVEGANVVKRHQSPTPKNPEGGILEKEMPIHVSNVMLWDSKEEKPTRVRYRIEDDEGVKRKIRIAVRSGTAIDS
jgi:large subunit ribosomal protein L24